MLLQESESDCGASAACQYFAERGACPAGHIFNRGTYGSYYQYRYGIDALHQVINKFKSSLVCPMNIFDGNENRFPVSRGFEDLPSGFVNLELALRR